MQKLFSIFFLFITLGSFAQNNQPRVFNVLNFGAKGDGKRVFDAAISSTSHTLTSATANFASTDVGKCVLIPGAGASGVDLATTISAFTNSTTVSVTAAAGTSVTADTVNFGTDNTAAFQAALLADSLNGGGKVFIPNGISVVDGNGRPENGTYMFNGPLNNGNCIVHIPFTATSASLSNRKRYIIEGETGNGFFTMLRGADSVSGHTGVVLMPITQGSGIQASFLGSVGPMNSNYATFRNFRILVPRNRGGNGPTIGGINAYDLYSAELENILVEQDGAIYGIVLPTNEVAGIIMPQTGVDLFNLAINCGVTGFKYGFVTFDHMEGVTLNVEACQYAYVFPESAYAGYFSHATAHWCPHAIYCPASTILGDIPAGLAPACFDLLNFEDLIIPGAPWFNYVDFINDSSNNLTGQVTYYFLQGHATDFKKYNGHFMMATQLGSFGNRMANSGIDIDLPLGDTLSRTSNISFNHYLGTGAHSWINWRATPAGVTQFQLAQDNAGAFFNPGTQTNGARELAIFDSIRNTYDLALDSRSRLYVGQANNAFGLLVCPQSSGRTMTLNDAGNVLIGDSVDPFSATHKGVMIYNPSTTGSVDVQFNNSGGITNSVGGLIRKQGASVGGGFANGFTFFNNDNGPLYFGTNGLISEWVTPLANTIFGGGTTELNAVVGVKANTTTNSSLFITPSAAVDVTSPTAGMIWNNGTSLVFKSMGLTPAVTVTNDLGTSSLAWRQTYTAGLQLSGNLTYAQNIATGAALNLHAGTYNDPTGSGSLNNWNLAYINSPVLTSTSSVTYGTANALYIIGPPTASTNVTITHGYSLYVNSGDNYMGNGTTFVSHVEGNSTSPAASGFNANVSSVTVNGTDNDYSVTITTSGIVTAGTVLCTITYVNAFSSTPRPIANGQNAASALVLPFSVGISNNTATIDCGTALAASTSYTFNILTQR